MPRPCLAHNLCLEYMMQMGWPVLYCAVLFFVLTPGILLRLPKGGSKMAVAATHALIFATLCCFTRRFVVERFQDGGMEEEGEYEEEEEQEERKVEEVSEGFQGKIGRRA